MSNSIKIGSYIKTSTGSVHKVSHIDDLNGGYPIGTSNGTVWHKLEDCKIISENKYHSILMSKKSAIKSKGNGFQGDWAQAYHGFGV